MQNDWHPVVNVGQEGIRSDRQDRAALDCLPSRVFPSIPEASEREQLAAVHFKAVRLLGLAFPLPLIEAICRDETSLRFERFPK
jgi:hypothetical protein